MKLYLLRHAERGHGSEQDILTELGKEQARRTGEFFKNIKLDKIFCGTKKRARETAKEIIKYKNCPVIYTSEVNERELGIFEGKSGKGWKEAIKNSGFSEEDFKPEGGETNKEAYKRAEEFYNNLKKEKSQNILVVSHSGFISNLIIFLLKLPEKENANFKTGFCAISYFEIDNNFNKKDFSIGELKHLVP